MPLPRKIFEPAFRRRKLGLLFASLIAILVYFASFATATEVALSMTTFSWDKSMESRLTVEIPAVDDEASTPQPERVAQVMTALRAMPGVMNVTPVPEEQTAQLLKPWIGQPELLKELPVPALIDIDRKDSSVTADTIRNALKGIVSDVHVEDHSAWLGGLEHLTRGLSVLSGLIILLTAITLIIAVSLLCRTIMATEREAISLLHVMGADDKDIARHFQFHARRIAAPAAFTGFGLAIITTVPFIFLLRHFTALFALQPMHWFWLGLAVLMAPLVAIGIAAFSARVSVLRLLYEMS